MGHAGRLLRPLQARPRGRRQRHAGRGLADLPLRHRGLVRRSSRWCRRSARPACTAATSSRSGRSPRSRSPPTAASPARCCAASSRSSSGRSSSAPASSARRSPARSCASRATGSTWSASSIRTRCRCTRSCSTCPSWARPTIWPRCSITNDIDHVVLAFTADHEAGLDVVRVCNELGVQVDIVPRLFEVVGSRAAVYSLEGTPLLGLTPPVLGASHRIAKRAMDIGGAAVRPGRALAALPRHRDRDPHEQRGPDLLPPDPHRPRPEAVHDHQVPHDGARRRGAQGRGRAPERALRPRRRAHVQDPRRPARDDRSAGSCASTRSTSSRSSGTCCAAR